MKNKRQFQIDFWSLVKLVENILDSKNILGSSIMEQTIDEFYFEMNNHQRKNMFEIISKNDRFDLSKKEHQLFYARYNPNNQYIVFTEQGQIDCFKHDGKFKVLSNEWVEPNKVINHQNKNGL